MSRSVGLVPLLVAAGLLGAVVVPVGPGPALGESTPDHLVVSELVTGAASASDEFIEVYNPTAEPLPLEGLELVYVSASGLSVSRRAAWEAGAPELSPGGHLLIANELGIYAGIADALYGTGMAAAGGSVALRIQGASSAIDAIGWGTASSTWLEGSPAPAPAPGASLERLPGGALGSTRDTDNNAADFVERAVPDPQNLASAPTPDPTAPTATPTPSPSSTATLLPSPTASADDSVSVATARALPDGTTVTIEATALTGSAFAEGGGYVADESGGIAILLGSGSFERGARIRVRGIVENRFSQRTLRADGADVAVLGEGTEPAPVVRPTGSVDETVEGVLVRVAGTVVGSPTALSAGLAYDVDDDSGPVRVIVGSALGIDTTGWTAGVRVDLHGVVGQRDSTGSGTSGYRVQPRDPSDVLSVTEPPSTGSPTPSGSPGSSAPPPSASPPSDGVVAIAEARSLPKNARVRVRGTVTLPPGVVDPISAVIQDDSGAILLRVGEEVGALARGDRIEIDGVRSTLQGMETLRVTTPAGHLGRGSEPAPAEIRTGDAGEALEARLVQVRGAVVATARRAAGGSVSFELDDGSGPLRVFLAAPLGGETTGLVAGAWVEATGVLGQETTGAQPLRGYRVWPRATTEVRVSAAPAGSIGGTSGAEPKGGTRVTAGATGFDETPGPTSSLAGVDEAGLAGLSIGATLVHGPWPELGLAGLLWDGERLVAVASASERVVVGLIADRRPPIALELTGLVAHGTSADVPIPVVGLGPAPGQATVRDAVPDPPSGRPPQGETTWVSLVGRLVAGGTSLRLAGSETLELRQRCDEARPLPTGTVQVTGIGLAEPPSILVPCGGIRTAPGVARLSHPAASGAQPAAETSQAEDAPPAAATSLRGVAAGLLAAAALVVAGATLVARRLDPDAGASSDEASEADEPAASGEDPEPAPRPLTLVSVPRERGPR